MIVSCRKKFLISGHFCITCPGQQKKFSSAYMLVFSLCHETGNRMFMKFMHYGKKAHKSTYTKSEFYPANLTCHCSF